MRGDSTSLCSPVLTCVNARVLADVMIAVTSKPQCRSAQGRPHSITVFQSYDTAIVNNTMGAASLEWRAVQDLHQKASPHELHSGTHD